MPATQRSHAKLYLSDNHTQEDINEITRFKYQYGNVIHSWIVEENAIQNAINTLQV